MSRATELIASIYADVARGSAALATLGAAEELTLDFPESLARYTRIRKQAIQNALRGNRKLEWVIIGSLVLLFVAALCLTLFGHLRGATWAQSPLVIPGLGITAAWPVKKLIRLREQNLGLAVLGELLPRLTAREAIQVLPQIFPGLLKRG